MNQSSTELLWHVSLKVAWLKYLESLTGLPQKFLCYADMIIGYTWFYAFATCFLGQALAQSSNDPSCATCVDKEQVAEIPMLNLMNYDPSLIMVCSDALTADDIYTSLMAVMVRVEDGLRRNGCCPDRFGLHEQPIQVFSLFGKLSTTNFEGLQKDPILGTYIETMKLHSRQLIEYAEKGFYDHRRMMKLVRMAMKMLVNKLSCTQLALDIAKNRMGWPSKFGPLSVETPSDLAGTGMGALGNASPTVQDSNDPGSISYSRWSSNSTVFSDPSQWPWNGWAWRFNKEPGTIPNRVPQESSKYQVVF